MVASARIEATRPHMRLKWTCSWLRRPRYALVGGWVVVGCAVSIKVSFYYYEWTRKGKPSELCWTLLLFPTFRAEHTSIRLDCHQGQPPACICLWWRSISFLWPLRQYLLENTGQTAIEMVRCFDWNCPKLKRCAMIWGTEHWTALSVGFPAHIWYKTTQICWVAEMGGLS